MIKRSIIFACLFVSVSLFSPGVIHAEEIHSSINNVTVLPAKFELSSTQGQTISQSLQIVNDSDIEYLYALSVNNISVSGENGEVGLGDSANQLSNLFASWITADEPSGKLLANQTKIINFKIKVPEIAEPGGKYASIVISLDRIVRNAGESTAEAKVVSLMMLTIAGSYEDNAQLIDFKASPLVNDEIRFTTRVRNQGLAHVKPTGTIVISNILGRKIDHIEVAGENVLPGSVRKTTVSWHPNRYIFGIYRATIVANYGKSNDKVITGVVKFSNFPFWPTSILALIILTVLYFSVDRLRSYLSRR